MATPTALDYAANIYLAVSLTPSSAYHGSPIEVPSFPAVTQIGNVGELSDVLLLAVPKDDWQSDGSTILQTLKEDKDNVVRVDVQEPKRRMKKGGDHDEL